MCACLYGLEMGNGGRAELKVIPVMYTWGVGLFALSVAGSHSVVLHSLVTLFILNSWLSSFMLGENTFPNKVSLSVSQDQLGSTMDHM